MTELQGLQKQEETLVQKISFLRQRLVILSDPAQQFTVTTQVAEAERELEEVRKRMSELTGLAVFHDETLLEEKVRQLTIDQSIGEVHLVNCDRDPVVRNFWKAFDLFLDRHIPFQFYFIVACPTQQPNSFSERMVYEVIIEELEEELGAINYVRRPDTGRVWIEDLPLGRNARNAQKAFKKYFSQRFGLDAAGVSFEEYLQTGLPRLNYEYVATVFDINASKWDQELMDEYLQWLIQSFNQTHENVPNFLFFFAVFLRDAHCEPLPARTKQLLEEMGRLTENNAGHCALITSLLPVRSTLVEDWIRDLGTQNQSRIDDVIRTMAAGLPDEKRRRFEKNGEFDMSDIEQFQEIVYRLFK